MQKTRAWEGLKRILSFTSPVTRTHLLQTHLLMRQMGDMSLSLFSLCGMSFPASPLNAPVSSLILHFHTLDSDSSNDSLISFSWCNSSLSSLLCGQIGIITRHTSCCSSLRHVNEGQEANLWPQGCFYYTHTRLIPSSPLLNLNPQGSMKTPCLTFLYQVHFSCSHRVNLMLIS